MKKTDAGRMLRDNRWICIRMEQHVNQVLLPWGITAVQAQVLLYILDQGPRGTSLTAIHRTFGYSMATLSGMLKRLREKGYVRAEHCEGDERCKLLFATEKGEGDRAALERVIGDAQRQFYSCLSPGELADLDRMQHKLLVHLSALAQETKEVSKS